MADNDDLTLEITGSSEKAESALDRVIAKISKLQEAFEKMSPSLTDFTKKMDSIASSSKSFQAFQKMAGELDKQSVSTKKAEANMAMYQARLDRANVSMDRSRVQSEKLATAQRKLAEAESIQAHNQAAFSMTNPDEFEKKFNHSGTKSVTTAPVVESAQMSIPTMKYDSARIQAEMDNLSAKIGGKKIKVNLDTDAATAEVRRMGEYIDSLAPQVSHMSAETQEKFNSVAHSLEFVSSQIDNQRMLLRNLRSEYAGVAQETGEGSTKSLQFEKRILSSSSAIDRLISKQEKLKTELSQVGVASDEAGAESERSGKRASSGWSRFQTMMGNMFLRISMFRLFSLVSQGVVTGIQNMALASSQANGTMSALATDSLYLKNSLAAALMPALQALVPVLNQVTEAVANVFNTIGMLTARIFNHASTVQIAKRSYVDYAKTINQSGNDATQVAQKEADAAAKAAEKAATAQEKAEKRQTAAEERVQKAIQEHQAKIDALKKSILGFDEINALSEKNDTWTAPTVPDYTSNLPTAASYNTAAAPAWNGMQSPTTMFETVKIPDWVDNIGNFTDQIGKIISKWWSGLTDAQKWSAGIGGTAGFIVGGIIGRLIGGPIGQVVGSVLGAAAGVAIGAWWASLTSKEKWSAGIGAGAGTIIGTIIGGLIGGKIGAIVGAILGGVAGALIGKWWADLTTKQKWSVGIGAGAGTVIGGIIGGILTGGNPIGIAVGAALGGTIGTIIGKWWSGLTTRSKWSAGVGAGSGAVVGGIIGGLIAGPIGVVVGAALGGTAGTIIAKWWSTLKTKQKWSVGTTGIGTVIGAIIGTIFLGPLGTILGAGIGGLAGNLIEKFWDYLSNKAHWKIGKAVGIAATIGGIVGMIIGGPLGAAIGAAIAGGTAFVVEKFVSKHAKGTSYHLGGPALVNDQSGSLYRELIRLPNGAEFIPHGRNVLIPNLPAGSSVLDAQKTKQLFPNYASGTDAIQTALIDSTQSKSSVSNVFANVFTVSGKINESVFGVSKDTLNGITADMLKASNDRMKIVNDELASSKAKWANLFGTVSSLFENNLNDITSMCRDSFSSAARDTDSVTSSIESNLFNSWNRISNNTRSIFNEMFSNTERGFSGFARSIDGTIRGIANNISSKIGGSVNGVINGINWTLSAVGSGTRVKAVTWPRYASGIGGHPGGPALVNDQAGSLYRELVQLPTGKTFIPQGRNVLIPDLPRGSKVLPAQETHMLFPHYAGGIGSFFGNAISSIKDFGTTMWQYISNPKKLLQIATDKFVSPIRINEPWLSLGTSAVKFITNHAADALKSVFTMFEAPAGSGSGVERWRNVASEALAMTGHFSPHNLSLLLAQMNTESGGNPTAINRWDINAIEGHPSQGLMQVIPSTFSTYALPGHNTNILDPLSNIIAAIRYTWSAYGGPDGVWGQGHGYKNGIGKFDFGGWCADGGLFTVPTLAGMGDAGPEAALPLNDNVYSQIAQGIQKNSDSDDSGKLDTERIVDSISHLEKAIKDMKFVFRTENAKLAEAVNEGNRELGRRYNN